MASTVLDPLANLLVAKIQALVVTYTSGSTATFTGYKWMPKDFDAPPVGVVGTPEVERVGVDQPELQMGSSNWIITFPVSLYVDLSEPTQAQSVSVQAAEALIHAIDMDPQLSGNCDDAKVRRVTPFVEFQRGRPLLGYECEVELMKQVPYT